MTCKKTNRPPNGSETGTCAGKTAPGPNTVRTRTGPGWIVVEGGGRRLFDYHPERQAIRIKSRGRLFEFRLDPVSRRAIRLPMPPDLFAVKDSPMLE